MAIGNLSSLGIGSNVLTYDVIDKLKNVDIKSQIEPLEKNLEKNLEKQKELALLNTSVNSLLSSSIVPLSEYTTYTQRTVNTSDNKIQANVSPGFVPQNIDISVKSLASSDIYQFDKKYKQRSDSFSEHNTSINFVYSGKKYDIPISKGISVEEVAQKITDETNGEVVGLIMKTGGGNPYQLIIQSKKDGSQNALYFGNVLKNQEPLKEGELKDNKMALSFVDDKGDNKKFDFTFNTSQNNTSKQNTEYIKNEIIQTLKQDGDFKDLIVDPLDKSTWNRPIEISMQTFADGQDQKGNSITKSYLIFNDKRGAQISIDSKGKQEDFGFSSRIEYGQDSSYSFDIKPPKGALKGNVIFSNSQGDSITIDLSKITNEHNNANDNKKDIFQSLSEAILEQNPQNATKQTKGDSFDIKVSLDDGVLKIGSTLDDGVINIEYGSDTDANDGLLNNHFPQGSYISHAKAQENFGFSNIQKSQDAIFTYNNIEIQRPTNKIDDVFSGLSFELKNIHKDGDTTTISVSEDIESLVEDVENFVKYYNESNTKLNELLKYDVDTKQAGVFQGDSSIRKVQRTLVDGASYVTTKINDRGINEIISLSSYGVNLKEDGLLSLDKNELTQKIQNNVDDTSRFFYGYIEKEFGKDKKVDGLFSKMLNEVESLTNGNGVLGTLDTFLNQEQRNLTSDRKKAAQSIDSKYERMAMQFASYDSIIAQANASFEGLQKQIDAAINAKK